MKPLLIRNGRVVDPASGLDDRRDVLVEDGKITGIDKKIEKSEVNVLDASNLVVAPGFIDLHVHLREPGKEGAETIATGLEAAAAGGFTAVCPMPNTQPVHDTPLITRYILGRAAEANGVRVYPVGAVTKGSQGEELAEILSMRANGAVAFSDDGQPVWNSRILRRALEYCKALDVPLIEHCEDRHLADEGVMNEGEWSMRLGLRGIPALAEELPVIRNAMMARLTGGRTHIAHLSTRGSLEAVRRGKAEGVGITCEVTPHHFTLTEEACGNYDTRCKMNPPLRSPEDVEALIEGLVDGTIDAIASDHAPHTDREKQDDFNSAPFGVIGLETSVALALDRLYHTGKITLTRLVQLFSTNPARLLGVAGGSLRPGDAADLTLFDPELEWTYRADEGRSRSQNTPFHNWSFRGKAAATIVAGKVVFQR